jgi:hypothetical protein
VQESLRPARDDPFRRVIRACGRFGVTVGLLAGVITFLMVDYGHSLMACAYEPLTFSAEDGQWECVSQQGMVVPPPDVLWSVVAVVVAVLVWTGIGALLGRLMRESERLDLDPYGIG